MRLAGSVVAALLALTGHLSAQSIPIHGSPQKSVYLSPSDWPTMSAQCHWKDIGVNPMNMLVHTHFDLAFPYYLEWGTGPITAKWTITMFHTDGYVPDLALYGFPFQSQFVTRYTLDAPFRWPLKGDPSGVVVYTGTITLDPGRGAGHYGENGFPVLHGWYDINLAVRTEYPKINGGTGGHVDTFLYVPIFSMINPSAPLPPLDAASVGRPRLATYCWAWGDWNAIAVETFDILPFLGPVASDVSRTFSIRGTNYGSNPLLPPGTFEYRIDPDLHNNIPGTIIQDVTAADANPDTSIWLNVSLPGFNPTGTHKQMFRYNKPTADGVRELDALLVWNQVIGTNTPPPPPPPPPPTGCTAGNATTPATIVGLDGVTHSYIVTVNAACVPVSVAGPF